MSNTQIKNCNLSQKNQNLNFVIQATIFTGLAVAQFILILMNNDGVFCYSLDDPYIHLALAENIFQGHYGVNPNEYSAPSSSIIWPFILVPFINLSFAEFIPLIINLFCSLGIIWFINQLLAKIFSSTGLNQSSLFINLIAVILIFIFNLHGLMFTGMEHSLQCLGSIALIFGLLQIEKDKKPPVWFLVAIVLSPLVRYEMMAIVLPALFLLFLKGHLKAVVTCSFLILFSICSFSIFLISIGLDFLPSSVLTKSETLGESNRLLGVFYNLVENLEDLSGLIILLFTLIVPFALYFSNQSKKKKELLCLVGFAALLHLLVGRIGWFHRYEIYLWMAIVSILLYVFQNSITSFFQSYNKKVSVSLITVFGVLVSLLHIEGFIKTPLAASNIYRQQYQMQRFVKEHYNGSVAVNDLGWVAWRNQNHVLDYWGLASSDARKLRMSDTSFDWMNHLADDKKVDLVMIYPSWFEDLPQDWIWVGNLILREERVSAAKAKVGIYLRDPEKYDELVSQLKEFEKGLPTRTILRINTKHPTEEKNSDQLTMVN